MTDKANSAADNPHLDNKTLPRAHLMSKQPPENRFEGLPAEIRLLIYQHFLEDRSFNFRPFSHKGSTKYKKRCDWAFTDADNNLSPITSLMTTSKLICNEVGSMQSNLFASSNLIFIFSPHNHSSYSNLKQLIPSNYSLIQKLTLVESEAPRGTRPYSLGFSFNWLNRPLLSHIEGLRRLLPNLRAMRLHMNIKRFSKPQVNDLANYIPDFWKALKDRKLGKGLERVELCLHSLSTLHFSRVAINPHTESQRRWERTLQELYRTGVDEDIMVLVIPDTMYRDRNGGPHIVLFNKLPHDDRSLAEMESTVKDHVRLIEGSLG